MEGPDPTSFRIDHALAISVLQKAKNEGVVVQCLMHPVLDGVPRDLTEPPRLPQNAVPLVAEQYQIWRQLVAKIDNELTVVDIGGRDLDEYQLLGQAPKLFDVAQVTVDFRQCKIGIPIVEKISRIVVASERLAAEKLKNVIGVKPDLGRIICLGKPDFHRTFLTPGQLIDDK